jgi:polyphosphate glucokinase
LVVDVGGTHVKILATGQDVKKLKALPPRCRAGENANAFLGGFRLWKHARKPRAAARAKAARRRSS